MREVIAIAVIVLSASIAKAGSCSNVHMVGSTGQYQFVDNMSATGGYIFAHGVFRRRYEKDEAKQSHFNLTDIHCEKTVQFDGKGEPSQVNIKCEVQRSYVWSSGEKCFLDAENEDYHMREVSNTLLVGTPLFETHCHHQTLTINRATKEVSLTATRINREDCNKADELGFRIEPMISEVLMDCPKERLY